MYIYMIPICRNFLQNLCADWVICRRGFYGKNWSEIKV